jgi:hypothetical protein
VEYGVVAGSAEDFPLAEKVRGVAKYCSGGGPSIRRDGCRLQGYKRAEQLNTSHKYRGPLVSLLRCISIR